MDFTGKAGTAWVNLCLGRRKCCGENPGRVAEVLVEVGDEVGAEDLLVQLEDDELALQVKQADAALASARAALAAFRLVPELRN